MKLKYIPLFDALETHASEKCDEEHRTYVRVYCAVLIQAIEDLQTTDDELIEDVTEFLASDTYSKYCAILKIDPNVMTGIIISPDHTLQGIELSRKLREASA